MAFNASANFSTKAAAERLFKEPMLKMPSRHFPTIKSSTAGIARRSRKTFLKHVIGLLISVQVM